jgi:hypothetical protein
MSKSGNNFKNDSGSEESDMAEMGEARGEISEPSNLRFLGETSNGDIIRIDGEDYKVVEKGSDTTKVETIEQPPTQKDLPNDTLID